MYMFASYMYSCIQWIEPLNNGHIWTDRFVRYRELSSFGGKNVLPLYTVGCCIAKSPSYRGVLHSECPLSEVPLYMTDYLQLGFL